MTQTVNPDATWLHDGRARTLLEAILWHAGEAQAARDRVVDMTPIGIEYEGDNPYLFVEENGEVMKVLAAVKERWDHNERILVERTFEGRKGRYD